MADIVPPDVRSRMMSGIRARDTRPEVELRSGLHRLGLRFTLNSSLPGKPDIVLPRWRVAVFFHGCFWHGHDCPLFRMPSTRTQFWAEKIEGNRTRDARVRSELLAGGWRVAVVWECAVRGTGRRTWSAVCATVSEWILSGADPAIELSASNTSPVPVHKAALT
jgi:DNA mismatch endonuclease (patch repair protein)